MSLSEIIHGNRRYERKFGEILYELKYGKEDYDINTLNNEIIYLKNQRNHGRLKQALESNYRDISYSTVDEIIEKIQDKRNSLARSFGRNRFSNLENIIDGKENFSIMDRLDNIENRIDYAKNENERDSLRYVLKRLDSYYMRKKAEKDDEFKAKKDEITKKIKYALYGKVNIIEGYKKESYESPKAKDRKKGTNSKFRNLIYGLAVAGLMMVPNVKSQYIRKDIKIPKISYEIPSKKIPKKINFNEAVKERKKHKRYKIDKNNIELIINKARQRMYVVDLTHSDTLNTYLVSTGINKGNKTRVGDSKTPEGIFRITEVDNSRNWYFHGRRAYGPFFLRLSTRWGDIGIHGTDEPWKLGHRASHGCIRIRNRNLRSILRRFDWRKLKVKIERGN